MFSKTKQGLPSRFLGCKKKTHFYPGMTNGIKVKRGFTLIELLVVIAIIALLSSVVLASLSQARAKARDAKRVADMKNIYQALQIYQDRYGCIPITSGSSCGPAAGVNFSDTSGWDYSSKGNFMFFLATGTEQIMSSVPVDPINNMTGDSSPINTYGYKYFCYNWDDGQPKGLALGYHNEVGQWGVRYYQLYRNPDFICK